MTSGRLVNMCAMLNFAKYRMLQATRVSVTTAQMYCVTFQSLNQSRSMTSNPMVNKQMHHSWLGNSRQETLLQTKIYTDIVSISTYYLLQTLHGWSFSVYFLLPKLHARCASSGVNQLISLLGVSATCLMLAQGRAAAAAWHCLSTQAQPASTMY